MAMLICVLFFTGARLNQFVFGLFFLFTAVSLLVVKIFLMLAPDRGFYLY